MFDGTLIYNRVHGYRVFFVVHEELRKEYFVVTANAPIALASVMRVSKKHSSNMTLDWRVSKNTQQTLETTIGSSKGCLD